MNAFMDIVPGAHVNYAGEQYVITHILTVESVLAKHIESGRSQTLNVAELEVCRPEPLEHLEQYETPDSIRGKRWQEAGKSYDLIKPVLDVEKRTLKMVEEVAKTAGPGRFRGANFPLSAAQIDHTPVDAIMVDNVHRHPIGRAWLTLLIDLFSRMVLGYHISFDMPKSHV
jgi:hypothetical protein